MLQTAKANKPEMETQLRSHIFEVLDEDAGLQLQHIEQVHDRGTQVVHILSRQALPICQEQPLQLLQVLLHIVYVVWNIQPAVTQRGLGVCDLAVQTSKSCIEFICMLPCQDQVLARCVQPEPGLPKHMTEAILGAGQCLGRQNASLCCFDCRCSQLLPRHRPADPEVGKNTGT